MVGGNDVLEFEEANYDALVTAYEEEFGEEPDDASDAWHKFVIRCFSEQGEGYGGDDR